jgi:two-component system sensor histidine kinase DesK
VRNPLGTWLPPARTSLTGLALLSGGAVGLLLVDLYELPLSRRSVLTGLMLLIVLPAVLLGQYAPPPHRLSYRARWALLGVQAALTYGPILALGLPWLNLLGFLAGSVLLTVPRPASLVVSGMVCASGPLLVAGLEFDNRSGLAVLLATLVTAGSVYAITQLALHAARLHSAQTHTTREAVARERDRIARDLHDVLGSALAQIATRAESSADPVETLSAIAALARQAITDTRALSHGTLALSLRTEVDQAVHALGSAGITLRLRLTPGPLPPAVDHCLAVVLREAVANALHHSAIRDCAIELRRTAESAALTITNDGAGGGAAPGPGIGLASLRIRVTALGGTLTASHPLPGKHRLEARVPLG